MSCAELQIAKPVNTHSSQLLAKPHIAKDLCHAAKYICRIAFVNPIGRFRKSSLPVTQRTPVVFDSPQEYGVPLRLPNPPLPSRS